MRILLIEDDAKIASFIEKGLKEAGFSVDKCADGQSGLESRPERSPTMLRLWISCCRVLTG